MVIDVSGDVIVGIDIISLLLLCMLFAVELYAFMSGNDILLVACLASMILLYCIRVWNRRRASSHYEYSPEKNTPTEETR